MASALVQKTPNTTAPAETTGASSLTTVAFGSSITVGNRLIAACNSFQTGGTAIVFTDLKGNIWATDVQTASGNARCHVGSAPITTGGASGTITATADASGTDFILGGYEVSGLSGTVSDTDLNTGSDTAPTTAAITATGACFYIATFQYTGGGTTLTSRTDQALHSEMSTAFPAGDIQYKLASGSQTLAWVIGATSAWLTAAAAYADTVAGSDTLFAQAIF